MSGSLRRGQSAPLLRNYFPSPNEVSPIIREDDEAITIRRPLQYHSINRPTDSDNEITNSTRATINRYRYYNRLAPHRDSTLIMPNHVVPSSFFLLIPFKQSGSQNSIVTIFAIWNTMVGTSILSMPWALEKAGFACGIGLMLLMAAITLYTAYRVLKSPQRAGIQFGPESDIEFSDICRHYLGRWGEYTSIIFSLVTLLGAVVVYWVLMTNFLYNSVAFVYGKVNNDFNISVAPSFGNITDVYCPDPSRINNSSSLLTDIYSDTNHIIPSVDVHDYHLFSSSQNHTHIHKSLFQKLWVQNETVPFFLILVLGPIINFKSPTFFTKFNALGTVSVLYIMTLVGVKGGQWGVNIDFESKNNFFYIPEFQWTFPALTGILSLAMFIHNCVLSIVRNQRNPENNGRDLSLAYICVATTYIFVGVVFYICFPLPKPCIEDNLLNNFHNTDVVAFTARIFLFFQMVTVFPLLMYIFRVQFFNTIYHNVYPSVSRVVLLNLSVIGVAVVFAVFLPKIGTIIRFSGALCGLVYIFALPCIVYLLSLKDEGKLKWPVVAFHAFLILLGLLNFISQFLILGED